jgi:hypothetical protein
MASSTLMAAADTRRRPIAPWCRRCWCLLSLGSVASAWQQQAPKRKSAECKSPALQLLRCTGKEHWVFTQQTPLELECQRDW